MASQKSLSRIFNDSLAIVMPPFKYLNTNGHSNSSGLHSQPPCFVLQGEALEAWKEMGDRIPTPDELANPLIDRLARIGILAAANRENLVHEGFSALPDECLPSPVDIFDQKVLSMWAFQNRIPLTAHLELTSRCNLQCIHCYCVPRKGRECLNTEEMIRVIDSLANQGTFFLVLTGGEIFARNDVFELLEYIESRQFVVRLNTNGTLLDAKRLSKLSSFNNIYRVHVSLYGSKPEVHDSITQVKGSFLLTLKSLENLASIGIPTRINCSVMRYNFEDIPNIKREIADRLGFPIRFDSAIYPRDDGSTDNLDIKLSPSQETAFKSFNSVSQPNDSIEEDLPSLCKAGFSFLSVSEDGSVYPCPKMRKVSAACIGNIALTPLSKLWNNSQQLTKLRSRIDRQLSQCDVCNVQI